MKLSPLQKLLGLTLAVGGMLAQTASGLITIDTVPVGNAGNAADHNYSGQGAFGAVDYDYRIGKYEVTLNQYTAFLNAVGTVDTYSLYNANMAADLNIAGIARNGVSGSYTYSVIGSGNRPVTYVNWFDSARFANWLHNGQPTGVQATGTTETGAYTLNGAISGIITRNANWTYGLPSENEWYKAAYHQPAAQGGDSDDYWFYPTRSNTQPNSRNGSDTDPNSANIRRDDGIANGFNGGFAVTDSAMLSPSQNYLTDTGAFRLADSFYGTFDQVGNVWEWNDTVVGATHGFRGGSWNHSIPASESSSLGFRVVVVPEPSIVGLIALGMALVVWKRK